MSLDSSRRVARRFFISGDVQGVGYRFFAQRAAARHQVVGYVKNLSDGRVESLAEGSPTQVEAFKHDLATGPRFGHVDHIEELNLDPIGHYSPLELNTNASSTGGRGSKSQHCVYDSLLVSLVID